MADPRIEAGSAPPRRRRFLRVFAIVCCVLLLLVVGLVLFLHTTPARQFVLRQVTQLLEQQNIEFNTDELRYNLLDLSLTLRNLRIRSGEAPDLPPFAVIDRVALDLSLRELLRRRYVLQSGKAQGVSVHYVVDQNGRDNVLVRRAIRSSRANRSIT